MFSGIRYLFICICLAVLAKTSYAETRQHPQLGEKLAYRGYWFGLPVGEGSIEIDPELHNYQGNQVYAITASGKTADLLSTFYPIEDRIDIKIDANTLQPLYFEKNQREGNYRAHERVLFDSVHQKAHYESLLNQSTKEIDLPQKFYELLSSLYWFRNLNLTPKESHHVNLYTDEKVYNTEILVKKVECLELLKRGTFRTLVIEPKASFKGLLVKRGRIWAYLTDDEYKIPLLIKATTPWGSMSAVIKEESIPDAVSRECTL